jgi:hypothetical protein
MDPNTNNELAVCRQNDLAGVKRNELKEKYKDSFAQLPVLVVMDNKLSFGAHVLYALLNYYGRNRERTCFPSNQTLADLMSVSARHIKRLMAELYRCGWIGYDKKARPDGGHIRHINFPGISATGPN